MSVPYVSSYLSGESLATSIAEQWANDSIVSFFATILQELPERDRNEIIEELKVTKFLDKG